MKIIFVDQNKDFKVAIPLRAVLLAKHSIAGAEKVDLKRSLLFGGEPLSTIVNQKPH